jgi:class 3 adenylate cyclase
MRRPHFGNQEYLFTPTRDLIGSGGSQEQAIVGETPNLAARLQGVAEPNSVVIAESARKLVGNLFELQDLGVQDVS